MNDSNSPSRPTLSGRWLVVLLMSLLLAALVLIKLPFSGPADPVEGDPPVEITEVPADAPGAVTLAMEIAGEREANGPQLAFASGESLSLLAAMKSLATRYPQWQFEHSGEGKNALLTQLAGRENEGAGGRDWTYEVNGALAPESFGVYTPEPGDHILWKFAPSE